MKQIMTNICITILSFMGLVSSGELYDADSPIERLFKANTAGPQYRFSISYDSKVISTFGTVDPTLPFGQRVRLMSPPVEAWPKGFAAEVDYVDSNVDAVLWCNNFKNYIPRYASTLVAETSVTVTYRFTPISPDDNRDEQKIFKNLKGEAVIDKASAEILSFKMYTLKPFNSGFFAKIKMYEVSASCEESPDGRRYNAEKVTSVKGKIGLSEIDEQEIQKISNLQKISL